MPTSQNKGNLNHFSIERFIANWQYTTYCMTEAETLDDIIPSKFMLRRILDRHLCKLCNARFDCKYNEENQNEWQGCALRNGVVMDIIKEMEPYF
jgi:hypothetical protein